MQLIEIGAHGRQRLVIFVTAQALDHRDVADAQSQDESPVMQIVERNHGPPSGEGIARIDVGDRAADHELFALRQKIRGERYRLIAARFGIPQRAKAVLLDGAHEVGELCAVQLVGRVPHAQASKLHGCLLRWMCVA